MNKNITIITLPAFQQLMLDMPTLVETMELESYIEWELNRMVVDIRAFVLAEELVTEEKRFTWHFCDTYQIPDGWWQCFKLDCFPKWLLRKFPARMKTIRKEYVRTGTADFTKYATYPKATISIPKLGAPVYKYKITTTSNQDDTV